MIYGAFSKSCAPSPQASKIFFQDLLLGLFFLRFIIPPGQETSSDLASLVWTQDAPRHVLYAQLQETDIGIPNQCR